MEKEDKIALKLKTGGIKMETFSEKIMKIERNRRIIIFLTILAIVFFCLLFFSQ